MSTFRRVVTGHNPAGKSMVASDSTVKGVAVPGLAGVYLSNLWGADQPYNYPDNGAEASHPSWFPPIGGVRFVEFILAPDSTPADTSLSPDEIASAANQLFPGLLSHFNDQDPGMHRSASTDMLYVLCWPDTRLGVAHAGGPEKTACPLDEPLERPRRPHRLPKFRCKPTISGRR